MDIEIIVSIVIYIHYKVENLYTVKTTPSSSHVKAEKEENSVMYSRKDNLPIWIVDKSWKQKIFSFANFLQFSAI